ncbi:hypothetical protein Ndes2526B_g03338 [Nannochloris sp. 'desiccata']
MSQYMFHMCSADTWTSLKQSSTPYYPPTYEADGFIHLTADPSLLLQVGNHFYKGDPGKWTLLVIDSSKLTSEVKFEPAAPVGERPSHGLTSRKTDEPLFPHLYGTIDFESIIEELDIKRGDDGTFLSINDIEKYCK